MLVCDSSRGPFSILRKLVPLSIDCWKSYVCDDRLRGEFFIVTTKNNNITISKLVEKTEAHVVVGLLLGLVLLGGG